MKLYLILENNFILNGGEGAPITPFISSINLLDKKK